MDRRRWLNVRKARGDYLEGRSLASGLPLEAFIEVSARCNLRCRMCPIGHDTRYRESSGRPPVLEPSLFTGLQPLFPTLLRANLYGLGEPLLNPHLCDFIAELSEAGVETSCTTNGTLIDDDRAEELAVAGLGRVSLSIDGATAATYESIRQGASFDDATRGLHALVAARARHGRPWITINFVAMASNLPELPALVDLAAGLDIREINVEPLFSWDGSAALGDHYGRESLGLGDRGATMDLLLEARDRALRAGIHFSSYFLASEGSMDFPERMAQSDRQRPGLCSEPWATVFVTVAGEVRTCCLNDQVFGSLRTNTIAEIWRDGPLSDFRSVHRRRTSIPAGCENCVRNGRSRISPFFVAVEPISYRPLIARDLERGIDDRWTIAGPRDGSVVTDPIVVTGSAPHARWRAPFGGNRSRPSLFLDREPVAVLDHAVVGGGRFALLLPVPYLTEGEHILSLAERGARGPGASPRSVSFWRPTGIDDVALQRSVTPAVSTAGIGVRLWSRARTARVVVDGRPWHAADWHCSRVGGQWRGIAVLDLQRLQLGRHEIEIWPADHSRSQHLVQRVAH